MCPFVCSARRRKAKAEVTLVLTDIGEYADDVEVAEKHALWKSFGAKHATYYGTHNDTKKILYFRPSKGEIPQNSLLLPKTMTKAPNEV